MRNAGCSSNEGNPGRLRYMLECSYDTILVTARNKYAVLRLAKGKHLIEVQEMDEGETEQLLNARLDRIRVTSSEHCAVWLPSSISSANGFNEQAKIGKIYVYC